MPRVSVLIVTLLGGVNLRNCLISLKRNHFKEYELVVVINGGRKDIEKEVHNVISDAKILFLKSNLGFAAGNNEGLKKCLGKYILFLNDDTVIEPDMFDILVETLHKNNKIAVLQRKTIFTTGKLQVGGDFLTATGFLYHYGYGKDPDDPIYNYPLIIFSANGNCMLVRRSIIKKVGLFDKDFYAYLEETDFCHRVWLAGYRVAYLPQAVVYHKGSETVRTLDKSIALYHPYKNRLCAYLKNLNLLNLIRIIPILIFMYQLITLYYLSRRKFIEAFYIQKALCWNIAFLPRILAKRRRIQLSIRKVPDYKFMDKVSYNPRLSYYLNLIRSLENYRDDDLVNLKFCALKEYEALNKKPNILIASFSPWKKNERLPINGNVEQMISFFAPKTAQTILIDQPYPGSDKVMPRIEIYDRGRLKKITSSTWRLYILYPFLLLTNKSGTRTSFKIRDFFSVIDWGLNNSKTKYDYFIGLECINALAGLFLRKWGIVNNVIYYVSDYSPQRYRNKWFNTLYLALDRFCARHADYIWDVSLAIQPARLSAGLKEYESSPVIHVPNALYKDQIKYNSLKKITLYSLIFMGTLGIENGIDIAIAAMPHILKKYPQATLNIIGGGREQDVLRLKSLIRRYNLEKKIKYYGFIMDSSKMSAIIRGCSLALATYRAFPGSPRYYGDAGKIRVYAASGLPILTTAVPPLGREATKQGAALIIKDNSADLAKQVIKVFSDKFLYEKLRKGAIAFARHNTWENSFGHAFKIIKNLSN